MLKSTTNFIKYAANNIEVILTTRHKTSIKREQQKLYQNEHQKRTEFVIK